MRVPKFRTTQRFANWLRRWGCADRSLTRPVEQVFFKSKEPEEIIANNIVYYAAYVGKLEVEFENLIKKSDRAVLDYATVLWRSKQKISEDLQDSLKGKTYNLVRLAQMYEERLPKHLEDSLENPAWALEYAKSVLKGRLPAHLEDIFFKDATVASRYAFQVIRGFAPVRLPEALHNFMIMESFKNPEDHSIKIYMEASESDPNKIGNTVRGV